MASHLGAVWMLLAAAAPLQEQDTSNSLYLFGSVDVRQQWVLLDSYVEQKQWQEAVELLQNMIDKQTDKLAPSSAGSTTYISLNRLAHRRISELPDEAVAHYRSRVDGQANALWKDWEKNSNPDSLKKIADQFLCSTVGEKAVDALGDLALASGRFSEATSWWSLLSSADASTSGLLHWPKPKLDAARLSAKLAYVHLLAGERNAAERQIAYLRRTHPAARGKFGGEEANYADRLEMIARSPTIAASPNAADWTTFAGNPARNKSAAEFLRVGGIEYSWDLRDERGGRGADDGAIDESRLPFHPVVVGDDAYVASDAQILKCRLTTGKVETFCDLGVGMIDREHLRVTLSIHRDRLFAVTHQSSGNAIAFQRPNNRFAARRNFPTFQTSVHCFHLSSGQKIWEANAAELFKDRDMTFEGAPAVGSTGVYVGVTRYDALHSAYVACLDFEYGKLVWLTNVCEAMAGGSAQDAPMFNLLSLGDSAVYYCTNLGAVAALDKLTGRTTWASSYKRRAPVLSGPLAQQGADVNPCVVHGARVFAMPRDAQQVICYSATTGERLWQSAPFRGFSHLLGVVDNRLIATGSQVAAFDVETGKVVWRRPINSVPGFGRGLLAGGLVYWPTRMEIHVFRADDGSLAHPPIDLVGRFGQRPGNLLAARDRLLIAQSDRLVAFGPPKRLIERIRGEIAANPRQAEPHFRAGELLALDSQFEAAANEFRTALELAAPTQTIDGQKLDAAARLGRFNSLLTFAKQSPEPKRTKEFAEVRAAAVTPDLKLQAAVAEAETAAPKRRMELALTLLQEPPSASGTYQGESGRKLATRWLTEAIAKEPALESEYETAAAKAIAGSDQTLASLAKIGQKFPIGLPTRLVLKSRAKALYDAGQFKEARTAYSALDHQPGSVMRPEDLAHFADCFRQTGEMEAASFVEARRTRLAGGKLASLPNDRPSFGMRQTAERTFFSMEGWGQGNARLQAWLPTPQSTTLRWQSLDDNRLTAGVVDGPVQWIGRGPFGVAVLTGNEITCFHESDGKKLWSFELNAKSTNQPPFQTNAERAKAERAKAERSQSPGTPGPEKTRKKAVFQRDASQFAAAGAVFLLIEDFDLVALSATDGTVRWRAPLGQDSPPHRLAVVNSLVYLLGVQRTLAFEPDTGKKVIDVVHPDRTGGRAPISVQGLSIFAKSRSVLTAISERDGTEIWSQSFSAPAWRAPNPFSTPKDDLVVIVDGTRLARLQASAGKVVWEVQLAAGEKIPAAVLTTQDSAYFILGDELHQRRVQDGVLGWRRPVLAPLNAAVGRPAPLKMTGPFAAFAEMEAELELRLNEEMVEVYDPSQNRIVSRYDAAGAAH